VPWEWPKIEGHLKQEKSLQLQGKARGLNVILLAAPTGQQLQQLVKESKLLKKI
jgi:hypothetical protein